MTKSIQNKTLALFLTFFFYLTHVSFKASPISKSSEINPIQNEIKSITENTPANGINILAFDLFKSLSKQNENLFFSPFCIVSSFAMLYPGSIGETKNEIQRFFHFSQSASDNSMLFNKLNNEILAKPNSSSEVNVANALWIQKNFKIKEHFLTLTKNYFNSELYQQDFVKTPKESCDAINRWASEKTNRKITSIIKTSDLDEFTRLILTNSIYFEGKWENEFDKSRTKDTIFHNSDKTESTVRMMHQTSSFNYFEDSLFQALEIPYEDDYSMIVLLPKSTPADFDKVDFNHQTYQKSISSMTYEDVVLSMPKFDLQNEIQLSDVLQANGLKTSFTAAANFNEITDNNLYIKKCYQSAYISVNEEKTQAAAVGVTCVSVMSAISENPSPPKVFNMNHPFVFLILSKKTQTILFCGIVNDLKNESN